MTHIHKNTIQNISKIIGIAVFLCTGTYIACVYNTVLTVSKIERIKGEFQKTEVTVSQKEHEYIQSVSNINIAYAEQLGYIRVPEDKVAYLNLDTETALAIR